jgi:hypothetical protein
MSSTRERSASFVQRGEISLSRDSGDKRARLWCPSTKSAGRWKRGAGRVSRPKSLHEDEVPGVRAAEPSPRCRRPPALRRRDAVPDAVGARGGEPALGRGARAARSPASLEDAGSGAPLYSPRSSQRPRRGRPYRPAAMARRERSRRVRPRRAPREDCAARRPRNARGGAGRGPRGPAHCGSPQGPRRTCHAGHRTRAPREASRVCATNAVFKPGRVSSAAWLRTWRGSPLHAHLSIRFWHWGTKGDKDSPACVCRTSPGGMTGRQAGTKVPRLKGAGFFQRTKETTCY